MTKKDFAAAIENTATLHPKYVYIMSHTVGFRVRESAVGIVLFYDIWQNIQRPFISIKETLKKSTFPVILMDIYRTNKETHDRQNPLLRLNCLITLIVDDWRKFKVCFASPN